jgi:two-component system, cell cycle sensor histidine kinase and response regulator CckA
VGQAQVAAGATSQAGFTLASGEPAVISDAQMESRFDRTPLLDDHGITSGITVAIAMHGVLGAYSVRRREFAGDDVQFLLAVANVLTMALERQSAEADWQKLAAFAQLNPNAALELAADGTITYFNDAALQIALSTGFDHPRSFLPAEAADIVRQCLETCRSKLHMEARVANRVLLWSFHPVLASQVVHAYVEDITERLNLEAQLRQSQKMESVGQLAAGVAHDFNNMLTIIQGHAGMLMAKPGFPPGMFDSAQAIYFAAERAAALTRQLLMFSRKNVMQPRLLDLREVVANMSKMLTRLLGETIALQFQPPPEMPLVQGDTGMLEQVIMNLAVNARDAMPKGGRLTITTEPVALDNEFVQTHPQARRGQFVLLRVTDTGCGMDAATIDRIFEPFFTTKDVGKGTGLGLATVYGIVKQHEGWIEVNSRPGEGSTFSVFLPATGQTARAPDKPAPAAAEVRGGTETILVVEDEPVLRDMAQVILQECGYRVLEASTGVEALQVWSQQDGPVDLLLTDMVMPDGISGMELAQRLLSHKPSLKIIFTSGYNVDELDTDFIRKGGATFLQKPYTRFTLAKAVRQCLDQKRPRHPA